MESLTDNLIQFGRIFYTIVLPMLLLAGIGFALRRALKLDLATLTKLNFYFVIPALIYYSVVSAGLSAGEAGTAVGFSLAMIVLLAVTASVAGWLRRVPPDQRNALILTTMSYNSGNYGLPLQELAFARTGQSAVAAGLQSFVMITQNVMNFTLGVVLAASGRRDRHWRANLTHIAKFPPLYALAAGLLTVQIRHWLPGQGAHLAPIIEPFWQVITYIKQAFIAVALMTLGAQLASVQRMQTNYPVRLSVLLRLLAGPAIGLALVLALRLTGLTAQVLLISTSTPTAVNAMLLCMEFDNHPNYVARAVFYSTLLSPITVTLVVFLAQSGLI